MSKKTRTDKQDGPETLLLQVDSLLGECVGILRRVAESHDEQSAHHARMAERLLDKIEALEAMEGKSVESTKAYLKTLKSELSFHLKNIRIGTYASPVHARVASKNKPVQVVSRNII